MKTTDMRNELAQFGRGAHALATQILGNPADAADAVQDAMTTVLGAPKSYDSNRGPLKPWFLRLVRNRCIDLLRRRRPQDDKVEELLDIAPGPEQLAEQADRDKQLKAALASLKNDYRQIIVLRDYMDMSYAQIADVMDIPQGTVMSRLHRARIALAKAYGKDHEL
ncbi:MAG: sigma-70 family RNA polymerase sigma factor [Pseudomonadota bacterium]